MFGTDGDGDGVGAALSFASFYGNFDGPWFELSGFALDDAVACGLALALARARAERQVVLGDMMIIVLKL